MLCYVSLSYAMLCHMMLCYVMLCYVMLCYVMLCYVMLCYVILCYVMLCYVLLYCFVMFHHVISYSYLIVCYRFWKLLEDFIGGGTLELVRFSVMPLGQVPKAGTTQSFQKSSKQAVNHVGFSLRFRVGVFFKVWIISGCTTLERCVVYIPLGNDSRIWFKTPILWFVWTWIGGPLYFKPKPG